MIRTNYLFPMVLLLLTANLMSQEQLYVFYPTTIRPQVLQDKLSSSLGGVTVTVFGRFKDFEAKIGIEPPDAIIAKPALIEQIGGYTISVNAQRKGSATESYVLLAVNAPLETSAVNAETVIGVIDQLGRKGMASFTQKLIPAGPKLKRVTKVEDLLPLISFNMVSGILIEDVFVDYFKTTSKLEFHITTLDGSTGGVLALAPKNGKNADKAAALLKKNDKEICKMFEVDGWK